MLKCAHEICHTCLLFCNVSSIPRRIPAFEVKMKQVKKLKNPRKRNKRWNCSEIVNIKQGFVESKLKMYSLTYFNPYPRGLPKVEAFRSHFKLIPGWKRNFFTVITFNH